MSPQIRVKGIKKKIVQSAYGERKEQTFEAEDGGNQKPVLLSVNRIRVPSRWPGRIKINENVLSYACDMPYRNTAAHNGGRSHLTWRASYKNGRWTDRRWLFSMTGPSLLQALYAGWNCSGFSHSWSYLRDFLSFFISLSIFTGTRISVC